jgi:hypothetical protein
VVPRIHSGSQSEKRVCRKATEKRRHLRINPRDEYAEAGTEERFSCMKCHQAPRRGTLGAALLSQSNVFSGHSLCFWYDTRHKSMDIFRISSCNLCFMCICTAATANPESATRVGASYALRRHGFLLRSSDPKPCPGRFQCRRKWLHLISTGWFPVLVRRRIALTAVGA